MTVRDEVIVPLLDAQRAGAHIGAVVNGQHAPRPAGLRELALLVQKGDDPRDLVLHLLRLLFFLSVLVLQPLAAHVAPDEVQHDIFPAEA